jgi:hypothetical protein
VLTFLVEAVMTTPESRRRRVTDSKGRLNSAARRNAVREADRRRVRDHGGDFARLGVRDRRASIRRETDQIVTFMPVMD